MKTLVARTIRIVSGIAMLLLSIVGFLLPIMPGWPFLLAGVILLWPQSRLATWVKKKYVRIRMNLKKRKAAEEAKKKVRND